MIRGSFPGMVTLPRARGVRFWTLAVLAFLCAGQGLRADDRTSRDMISSHHDRRTGG